MGAQDRMFRVLVVEDDAEIAKCMKDAIELLVPRCEVQTADGYAKGVEALKRDPIDAVLVDYRMPGRSGVDFIRTARDLEPNVPAILMTAYGSVDLVVEACNALHVDGFLSKPVRAEELAHAVQGALERSDAMAQPAADGQPVAW
jgi:DNA-binding NtrC family response regulator